MIDAFYNILLHVNSIDFKNVTSINTDTRKIIKTKQFWNDKFNLKQIPIRYEPNFSKFERYEKCQSIANGVMTLMERDSHLCELGEFGIMIFNQENMIQYLPEKMINDMKEYINEDEDVLNDIPSSILEELGYVGNNNLKPYKQVLYFSLSYDGTSQPNISYNLSVNREYILQTDTFCSLQFLKKSLTDMIYLFPHIKLKDTNDVSYLPDIIYEEYYQNDTSRYREKYWKNKQWYL